MKKLSFITTLLSTFCLLCGCNKDIQPHVHDKDAQWQFNETIHWKKCSCGEEFDKGEHTIDENDCNCHTCGYHDPMFIVNEKGLLTGLTNFGKNYKGVLERDDDVKHNNFGKANAIGENAFEGCQASEIIIPKCVNAMHESIFNAEYKSKIKYEEEIEAGMPTIQWTQPIDGFRYKEDVYNFNVAMVNGLFYPTLKEAIENVKEDNTIIKIVKENHDAREEGWITVNHKIILESLTKKGSTDLQANFRIFYTGQLEVSPSITYSAGATNLETQLTYETCGTEKIPCLDTSSIYFPNVDKGPTGPEIYYHDAGGGSSYNALGEVQYYKDPILNEEVKCYAYGVFRFERESKNITGLTNFGKTINKLTISEFYKNSDSGSTAFGIAKYAFNAEETKSFEITVKGVKKLVTVNGHFQKGIFTDLIIKSGVSEIPEGAFDAEFVRGIHSGDEQVEIERKISKLSYVDINGCVNTIGDKAFLECCNLINVATKENGLKEIKSEVFRYCKRLQNVDFSKSISLNKIGVKAFYHCHNLNSFNIYSDYGWRGTSSGSTLAPCDLGPEKWPLIFKNSRYDNDGFQSIANITEKPIYVYSPYKKDSDGIHYQTSYYNTIEEVSHGNFEDGSFVRITNKYTADESGKNINFGPWHSVYITCDDDINREVAINRLSVERNAYVILGSNIKINEVVVDAYYSDVGGVAFTQHYGPTLPHVVYEFRFGARPDGEGANVCIELDGEPHYCTAFGLTHIYLVTDSQGPQVLRHLSHLGNRCREIEIKSQVKNKGEVFIESYHKEYHPEETGFAENNNVLTKVTFGNEVRRIGRWGHEVQGEFYGYAFQNCPNLREVDLGTGVIDLFPNTFKNCPKLRKIYNENNNNLHWIGESCFENCTALEEVTLYSKNLYSIDKRAFKGTNLKEFTFGRKGDWYVVKGSSKIPVTEEQLSKPRHAATYLRETYCEYPWRHV